MPTSQSKTPEMDELLKITEDKIKKEKEEKEMEQILEANINNFKEAMSNTISEIMKG